MAGVAGERVAGWVALAAVADLSQQLHGSEDGAFEQREEDLAVWVLADRGGDLPLELLDLPVSRRGMTHQSMNAADPLPGWTSPITAGALASWDRRGNRCPPVVDPDLEAAVTSADPAAGEVNVNVATCRRTAAVRAVGYVKALRAYWAPAGPAGPVGWVAPVRPVAPVTPRGP